MATQQAFHKPTVADLSCVRPELEGSCRYQAERNFEIEFLCYSIPCLSVEGNGWPVNPTLVGSGLPSQGERWPVPFWLSPSRYSRNHSQARASAYFSELRHWLQSAMTGSRLSDSRSSFSWRALPGFPQRAQARAFSLLAIRRPSSSSKSAAIVRH
jgi:hypothetical protein